MSKRLLATILVVMVIVTGLASFALADSYYENWLNTSHKNVYAGTDFSGINEYTNDYHNYNDLSHFKSYIAADIIKTIYQ